MQSIKSNRDVRRESYADLEEEEFRRLLLSALNNIVRTIEGN